MLQAALEQCLEYSDCSGAKLREIFSWGWKANPKQSWEVERLLWCKVERDFLMELESEPEVIVGG
jgi:hypothetical protein